MDSFRAAAIQMDCAFQKRDKNLATAESFLREAAGKGARVVVLPELFATGYSLYKDFLLFGEPATGPTLTFLQKVAKELDLLIAGSFVENEATTLHNSIALVGPGGVLGIHRKIHLWKKEKFYFVPGKTAAAVDTPITKFGLLICYDAEFPENARSLARSGCTTLLTASAIANHHVYDLATRSRALENGVFHVVANRVGREQPHGKKFELEFTGHSRIVGPDGTILAELEGEKEGIATAMIDLATITGHRERLPYLADLQERESR